MAYLFVSLFFHLSAYLFSFCLSVCPFYRPSVCFLRLSIPQCTCLTVLLSRCLSVFLSICLSNHLYLFYTRQSVCLFIHLFVCELFSLYSCLYIYSWCTCISLCPYICLSFCPSVCIFYLSVHPNVPARLSVHLSFYLIVCLSLCCKYERR